MAHYPTLFIGLGGSGGKTIAHIKRLLATSVSPEDRDRYYRFLLFDTDDQNAWPDLQRTFSEQFKANPNFISRDREWFNFGNFNPQRRWQDLKRNPNGADAKDILSWLDPQTADSFPDQIVVIGAEARRQLGRFCFAHWFRQVDVRLNAALESLNELRDKNVDKHVQIIVVTSSCGGTGSSVFFDFLYTLAAIYGKIAKAAPFLRAVVYSPLPYIRLNKAKASPEELIARYNANACAFFLELQHAFRRFHSGQGEAREDFVFPSWAEADLGVNWKPCDDVLIVDAQREGAPTFVPFDSLYSTVAELLFYLYVTSVSADVKSSTVNFDPNIASPSSGSFPHYSAAGYRAIEYPARLLAHYLADRFASEVVASRFMGGASTPQGQLRDRAGTILNDVLLGPFGSEAATAHEHSFRGDCRRNYLDGDAGAVARFQSIDEFCDFDPKKPDEPTIRAGSISRDTLGASMNDLHDAVRAFKASVRADFANRYGRPDRLEPDSAYGRIAARLAAEMEQLVDAQGIEAWAGTPGQDGTGLVPHLMGAAADRRTAAVQALDASNQRINSLWGNVDGLERIREEVMAEVERLGGVTGRLRSTAQLQHALERFAATRVQIVEESFRNLLLMQEVELLAYVAARDPEIHPAEYFTRADTGIASILKRLADQGSRIRAWLGLAHNQAQTRFQTTVSAINEQGRSLLTTYEPALGELMSHAGLPGDLAEGCLKTVRSMASEAQGLFETLTERGGRKTRWREVAPAPGVQSLDLLDTLLDGAAAFVGDLIVSNPTLSTAVNRSIESRLGDLSADQVTALKELVSLEKVAVFSPLSDNVRSNRPRFRLLVTSSSGDDGSVAAKLGYSKQDKTQAHLKDPFAPERVLAVKSYAGLYLEEDFPWVADVRGYYDRLLTYEPHLWKDGRIRVSGGASAARWRRAFSVGLAWGFLLQGEAWKKEPFAGVLTARLNDEPEAYLHDSPISVRKKEPFFLTRPMAEQAIDDGGRIEYSLPAGAFERVASAGAWGTAWGAFLKRPHMLANVEFFHLWAAGVKYDLSAGDGVPVLQVIGERQDRAKAFAEALPKPLDAVRKKAAELRNLANRHPEDEATIQVLGWVATELEEERTSIQAAFGDESL